MHRRVSLLLVLIVSISMPAFGQDAPPAEPSQTEPVAVEAPAERTLKIATRQVAPFVMQSEDGVWSGIAVDLWREIAGDLGYTYEFTEMALDDLLAAVREGRVDAAVAALTITAEREHDFDFTHPFTSAGLGIAVVPRKGGALAGVVERFLSMEFVKALGALAALLIAVGIVVWAAERKRNPEQFGGSAAQGLGSGFWWAAVTMTTVGYGDKAPATFLGRIVGLVWMFASIIVISGFTAAIASSLTVGELTLSIQGPEDLPGRKIGTVKASVGEAYLTERGIRARAFESVDEALEALAADQVEAVVYDEPPMRYLVQENFSEALAVVPRVFARQGYALALPSGSALREPINQALLTHMSTSWWNEVQQRYLGTD